MKKFADISSDNLVRLLRQGGIGVLLTDTLYGIVASANNPEAVERVYSVRGRDLNKPCIVLIGSLEQTWEDYTAYHPLLNQLWPGKVSVILPAGQRSPSYIHRGTFSIAFRMPDSLILRNLLKQTGPLIAPSANTDGMPPAMNIKESESYFGDTVDFYVDSGQCSNTEPSRLVKLQSDGTLITLRGKTSDSGQYSNHSQAKKI